MPTWKPCPCCDPKAPEHALLSTTCGATGDAFRLKVPWEARHDAIGWGDRARVKWKGEDGEDREGYEDARGEQGITAIDATGTTHRLLHGRFRGGAPAKSVGLALPSLAGMRKADSATLVEMLKARALKTGQRWITVHPNGKDEKGVPVLIQEEHDGSHRIIGGAGGKLTHLRLHGIKSEEEYAAASAEKGAARRDKEKARKAAQSPDDKGKEKQAKADVDAAKRLAEREFVQSVRGKAGGVSEDLDEEKLRNLSDGTRNLIMTRHHKKQLREAVARKDEIARKLVDNGTATEIESQAVKRAVEEDPVVAATARELAGSEVDLRAAEQEELKAERRANRARVTGGDSQVGARAAEKILSTIEEAPKPEAILERHGGRDDDSRGGALRITLTPSEEIERRSAQSQQDAKILAAAAKGGETPKDAVAQRVVAKALERAGVDDPEDKVAVKDALIREAARQQRRAEVQKARSDRFKEVEASADEGGVAAAERMLAYSDMVGGIASSASAAKKLGLTDSERTPMQEPEIAAAMDLLKDAQVLRAKQNEFKAMNKAAENGDYDKSRRAFDLDVKPADAKAVLSVEDDIRRELAERLLGVASPKRSEHLQALGAGHYDALADVGLGIGGQRYVDRPTVDAIGVGNAALLMRHALESDGHKPDAMLSALESHHVESLNRITSDAIDRADKYVPGLTSKIEDVGDIEKALSQMDAHESDIADAQRAVGSALGRMEATATLGQTFRRKLPEHMVVKAKGSDLGGTLQWLHSVGLKPADYAINYKDGQVEIPRASWGKMINRIPAEEVHKRALVSEIKAGKHDETGWLPPGIVRRAASTFTAPVPDAPVYRTSLDFSKGDVRGAIEDHVGSRLADGEPPHEILHDLLSAVNLRSAPDPEAYTDHVRALFPMENGEGRQVKYEENAAHFQRVADDYMQRRFGTGTGAFHAQDIDVDSPKTHEALFRTLAKNPRAAVAFTPTGQLSSQQSRVLRDHFYERMGYDPKDRTDNAAFQRGMVELGPEPDPTKGTLSLFGGGGAGEPSPEWREWAAKRDGVIAKHPREGLDAAIAAAKGDPAKIEAAKKEAADAGTPWDRYVRTHGSLELAQRAMQDEIRSGFVKQFADHYGQIHGKGLKVGVQEVTNRERHVKATASPEEAAKLRQQAAEAYAHLRKRVGGQFAGEGEGAVVQKYSQFLAQDTIDKQNQGGLFGAKVEPTPKARELEPGERFALGERAENQISSLMPQVGGQFEPDRPVGLFPGLNMDGPRGHQQRVLRMLDANGGREAAFLGTGSGKSLTSIGAFTQAHDKGQTKHGLYLVPSAVQSQFGSEMLRYTEPGKYKWATGEGKSHEERVAMLKDPSLHMRVMTHQSFRETATRLMAEHHGRTVDEMKADLSKASPKDRASMMRAAFDAHGIPRHMTYLDEAHMATDREGQDESATHMIMQAATHPVNATHFLAGTATPHKNDESEVYSMASLVDPERYADRHEFMQSFGQDLGFNPQAIRRELSHLTYSAKIDPEGVDRTDSDNPRLQGGGMFGPPRKVGMGGPIELTGEHKALVDKTQSMYDRARKAREGGKVDVEAIRHLSPKQFDGAPETEHEAIAERLGRSLGVLKESAMRRAVNQAPPDVNQKLQGLSSIVLHDVNHGTWRDRAGNTQQGKPSIVFSDSLAEARMIHEHLTSKGIRSALYHGGLSSSEREDIRLGFNPEGDVKPKHDVVVATSAAEAGINMQRAKVIHHYDVPQTEKSHAQRSGRAYRQGQQGDVEVHNWHTDADYEQAGRRRLRRKEDLASVFQTPVYNLDETGIAGAYHRALAEQHQSREVA